MEVDFCEGPKTLKLQKLSGWSLIIDLKNLNYSKTIKKRFAPYKKNLQWLMECAINCAGWFKEQRMRKKCDDRTFKK